ncbi:MAG: hypothetical protein O7F71_20600, partial [Gammaproteobacteria bacterium]|nr:hypothetical protein [Gammaproteobacteria bacterium]
MRSILLSVMLDLVAIAIGALDSLPNFGRTMLSAGAFAVLLCYVAARLPSDHATASIAYRKAALLSLLTVPSIVYFVMEGRLVVVVEALPGISSAPDSLWWALAAAWMIGVLWNIALSARANRKFAARYRDLEPADEKLGKRLAHWQQRLELKHEVRLGFGLTARPLSYGVTRSVIVLPRAIAHWPLSIQDVMLLGALAHIKRRNSVWLVIGQFVSALYWPIPWVRVLVANFNGAFEHTSDSLAASCYQDRLGYLRGLKHADQRLELDPSDIGQSTHLGWGDGGTLDDRQRYLESNLRDPSYDRIFWSMLPAIVLVMLLTGSTLEKYEEFVPPQLASLDSAESSIQSLVDLPVEVTRK